MTSRLFVSMLNTVQCLLCIGRRPGIEVREEFLGQLSVGSNLDLGNGIKTVNVGE